MMMENLKITVECLRDLVAFHQERIAGYRAMMGNLAPSEQHLNTLFNAFISQSTSMGDELVRLMREWGCDGNALEDGRYGLAWSVVKAVFSSKMPCYLLDKCRSGENALLIAYHTIEKTDGLAEPVRLLINRQKRDIIAAREWMVHFESLHIPQQPHRQPIGAMA